MVKENDQKYKDSGVTRVDKSLIFLMFFIMMIHVPTIPTGTKKKLCCQLYVFGNAIMMIKNDKI